jgi:hypothetical protein
MTVATCHRQFLSMNVCLSPADTPRRPFCYRPGAAEQLCVASRPPPEHDQGLFAPLKAFGRQDQSVAACAAWRRKRSTLAIAAGPGHSSTSRWGSGSSALLSSSTSSSSPRPFGNISSARGIS